MRLQSTLSLGESSDFALCLAQLGAQLIGFRLKLGLGAGQGRDGGLMVSKLGVGFIKLLINLTQLTFSVCLMRGNRVDVNGNGNCCFICQD